MAQGFTPKGCVVGIILHVLRWPLVFIFNNAWCGYLVADVHDWLFSFLSTYMMRIGTCNCWHWERFWSWIHCPLQFWLFHDGILNMSRYLLQISQWLEFGDRNHCSNDYYYWVDHRWYFAQNHRYLSSLYNLCNSRCHYHSFNTVFAGNSPMWRQKHGQC